MTQLLDFLEKESKESYRRILLMAMVSGIANGFLLIIVNHAAQAVAHGEDLTQYFFLYLISFILFIYTQWFAYERAIETIEEAIYSIRIRLTAKVKQIDLAFMEKMGSNDLYGRLTQNDALFSQSIPIFTAAAQLAILVIFSFLYLGYISPLSFLISIASIVMGVALFMSHSKSIKKSLAEAGEKETRYFSSISHLINGFKEIKINRNKGNDILHNIAEVSAEAKVMKIAASKQESRLWGFGRVFVYVLLPILVFILPTFIDEQAADIFKISAIMLFLSGPITVLVSVWPMLNRVNMAIGNLVNLEKEMDESISEFVDNDGRTFSEFKEIKLDNVIFSYPDADINFAAGPFDERIVAGELLFIVGGNGSGKSTFLKLLTGLYYPGNGRISVDSQLLDKSDYVNYRNLFAVIFTDFHLFDKFYGTKNIDAEKVNYWLKKMEMNHKVKYHQGGFTNTNLSTGQRKRLALIAAVIEEKPILILDEFAADQDPQFREYFYKTLLLELKNMGKTIIAVTHDDHYFHVADRILKMDEGKMMPYSTTVKKNSGHRDRNK